MATNQTNTPQQNQNKQEKAQGNPGQFGKQDDQTRRTTGQGDQESQNDQTRRTSGQHDQAESQMPGRDMDDQKQSGR